MRDGWNATLQRELAPDNGDPAAQLIGVVRADRDVGTPGYCGCAFLKAQPSTPTPAIPSANCAPPWS